MFSLRRLNDDRERLVRRDFLVTALGAVRQ
jgi:hypothetical protein